MKSNRGITLTSLIIYMLGLMMVVKLVTTFSSYFYNNLNGLMVKNSSQEQYSKFLSYITKDINSDDVVLVTSGINNEDCVIFTFSNGASNQYIFKNGSIYFVRINEEVEKILTLCTDVTTSGKSAFSYSEGRINVNFNINDDGFSNILTVKTGN